jgi:molybdopterin-binding protein
MKISVCNALKVRLKTLTPGVVNTGVVAEVSEELEVAIVTKASQD